MAFDDVLTEEHLGIHRCRYEIAPFDTRLTLDIEAEVCEGRPVETGRRPSSLISADEPWYVIVRWRLSGALTHHLCGEWCPEVHLECYGPGEEYTFAGERVKFDPCGDGNYRTVIEVPAGRVDPRNCGTMCCLSVTLSSFDQCGRAGHVFAFCKGPCIMFHHAPHEVVEEPE